MLRYVAELDGRWVAVLGSGSAALSCAARDAFIGWSRDQQYARLIHIANSQRFCVLPAGRVANLASAVLARALRRLPGDYLAVYGHRVLAVETFTDPARHAGACYAAAGFQAAGQTLGYGRSAGRCRHHGNPKRVWLRPLHRHAAQILSAPFEQPLLTTKENRMIDLNALPVTGGRASLLEALATVADPRRKRGIRHQIAATLTMVAPACALADLAVIKSQSTAAVWIGSIDPEIKWPHATRRAQQRSHGQFQSQMDGCIPGPQKL